MVSHTGVSIVLLVNSILIVDPGRYAISFPIAVCWLSDVRVAPGSIIISMTRCPESVPLDLSVIPTSIAPTFVFICRPNASCIARMDC